MASFYAVHHGPSGLTGIALRVLALRHGLVEGLKAIGLSPQSGTGFDTVFVTTRQASRLLDRAVAAGFNLRHGASGQGGDGLAIGLDECSDPAEVAGLLRA